MKKILYAFCILAMSSSLAAARPFYGRPHHSFHPRPRPVQIVKHHHGSSAAGFVAGLIGGTILGQITNSQPAVQTMVTSYPQTIVNTGQTCHTTTNIVTGAVSTYCTPQNIQPVFLLN